jgi:ring-1,2-phenylacetyl-CoA epoxidase subunit PaaD
MVEQAAGGRTVRTRQSAPRDPPLQRNETERLHLSSPAESALAAEASLARARAAVASVADPEIPVLTIEDLGVLRDIRLNGDSVEVTITPTYSGCPAVNMIALEIETALTKAGFAAPRVRTVLTPAWTTDWMTEAGRTKLLAYGIAPPPPGSGRRALFGEYRPRCPLCGSAETELISEFGSTSCKALHRCLACREPFDSFKCH